MTIVGGLDLHRKQITYDVVDTETGQLHRGRITPAERGAVREWMSRFADEAVELAVEAGTGWRFVVEECQQAGAVVHLAEPAEVSSSRGRKKRAKTDRLDAAWLRELLEDGRIPESWLPPSHVLELRATARLYRTLMEERTGWMRRIHAVQFHHGAPREIRMSSVRDRERMLDAEQLSPSGRESIAVALRVIDSLEAEAERLHQRLVRFAGAQPGCRALQQEYGIGKLTSAVIWSELGDARRFSSSDDAVRHSGLDISIYSSDGKRSPGKLTRQGPPQLRWALYEAGRCAARTSSPDHHYHQQVARRLGNKRATLSVARKLVRRCHHRLRELGDEAMIDIGA